MEHELKCWPDPFQAILDGKKTHEIRKTDRDFHEGDLLLLREYRVTFSCLDPIDFHEITKGEYTGRTCQVRVTYLSAPETFGLPKGLCVLSIRPVDGVNPYRTSDKESP